MLIALLTKDQPNGARYLISLMALALLPLVPEFWLWARHYDDIKAFASIAYYECIVSFLLLMPALILTRRWARGWVIAIGIVTLLATLVTGFQAVTVNARWDATAQAAVMDTNPDEAWGFLRAFFTPKMLLGTLLVGAGFASCIVVNLRSRPPSRRIALASLSLGLLAGAYGIHNGVRYGGNPFHRVFVSDDTTLNLIEAGINSYHPVLRLLFISWNYSATHDYRLKVMHETKQHLGELKGATTVPGAVSPRIVVLVIGESASRRHWSLYGYPRETTPRLAKLGDKLLLFRDTICRTVGTLTEIQGMLCTKQSSLPVFALFAAAGYRTHWFSAQHDQGPNDAQVAALVQTCDERVFLSGSYDENLLPLMRRAVAEPGKHLICLNLFGSHVRYEDRYPTNFAIFRGDGEKAHRLATYDNSIRYTDYVLAEMIDVLRQRAEGSCFLYLSDHAEDVYDSTPDEYLFRNDSVATDAMYEVPFVVWFSPEYRLANAGFVDIVAAARTKPFQTLALYHSLIDLARLTHPIYDPSASLFSPRFIPRERHVGSIGRIYHTQTGLGH